jgi:metallo-beta-lactamase class B
MIMSIRQQRPGFMDHANMVEWPASVKKVQEKFPQCKLVIPGHGSSGNAKLLEHTWLILEEFNKEH